MLSFSECLVCVCVFCLFTPVLFEEPSLVASNHTDVWPLQMSNCWKEKTVENNFFISVNYPFNLIKIVAVST